MYLQSNIILNSLGHDLEVTIQGRLHQLLSRLSSCKQYKLSAILQAAGCAWYDGTVGFRQYFNFPTIIAVLDSEAQLYWESD